VLAVRACLALAAVPIVRRRGVVVAVAGGLAAGAIVLPARASISYSPRSAAPTCAPSPRTGSSSISRQRGDRHGALRTATGDALDLRYLHRGQPDDAELPYLPLPLPLPGVRDPRARFTVPRDHKVGYVVLSSEVDSRVLAAARDLPGAGGLLRRAQPPWAAHREVLATAGEQGPVITVYRCREPHPGLACPHAHLGRLRARRSPDGEVAAEPDRDGSQKLISR